MSRVLQDASAKRPPRLDSLDRTGVAGTHRENVKANVEQRGIVETADAFKKALRVRSASATFIFPLGCLRLLLKEINRREPSSSGNKSTYSTKEVHFHIHNTGLQLAATERKGRRTKSTKINETWRIPQVQREDGLLFREARCHSKAVHIGEGGGGECWEGKSVSVNDMVIWVNCSEDGLTSGLICRPIRPPSVEASSPRVLRPRWAVKAGLFN